MAVSLGLHGVAVLSHWYDAPTAPVAIHNVLEVSLVTAKAVMPGENSADELSDTSPATAVAPVRAIPEPVPSSRKP